MSSWKVRSNAESGDGYCDISIEIDDEEIGIVIELKYAENAAFDDGMRTIYRYGIACYNKRCKVVSG